MLPCATGAATERRVWRHYPECDSTTPSSTPG